MSEARVWTEFLGNPGLDDAFLEELRERFMRSVVLHAGVAGCWLWNNDPTVYGRFWIRLGVTPKTNRAAYRLFIGPIPEGMDVLHLCNCVGCVNPLHIYAGTDADNARDRLREDRARGRWSTKPKVKSEPMTDAEFLDRYVTKPSQLLSLVQSLQEALSELK